MIEKNFEAESGEFSKILRSLEQFIQTVKGQNAFLTCSWRFLRSQKIEQLQFKLEKIIGISGLWEKLENMLFIHFKLQIFILHIK